jgi:exodeoxyribonuclease V alpha subunit
MPAPELIRRCTEQFGVEEDSVLQGVEGLIGQGEIIAVTRRYGGEVLQALYLPGYYQAETGIADKLHILKTRRAHPIGLDAAEIDRTIMRHLALQLSQNQLAVLVSVLSHRVAVITGGPGTGKTTLIRSLAVLLQQAGKRVLLAAPTGRAARRLTAVTRAAAMTIHKLLGYNPSRQQYEQNRDNPLDADVIIVDEASMVDTTLMYHLVDAIHITSRLIMVGDVFQLPSVGPGNVLSDLIRSYSIQTFELTKIFRQAAQSAIVVNAHKIRQGQMPPITTDSADPPDPGQFWFIEQHRPDSVVDTVMALCTRHMAERFGYDPVTDVQVLAPMHKGVAGTVNLNNVLQQRLNPNPVAASIIGRPYKLNDKVMHLKNNYAKEVFNGDIGYIATIDPQRERVSINYEHKVAEYDYGEMDEVALAYAISVHKSQGSEYPAVILPLLTQHYAMLYRSLVYTAVSRAKSMVIIVGSTKALALAVQNDRPRKRFSGLAECIAAQ